MIGTTQWICAVYSVTHTSAFSLYIQLDLKSANIYWPVLEHLNISNNQISSVPPELGLLKTLMHLKLSQNKKISKLPVELGNLKKLLEVRILCMWRVLVITPLCLDLYLLVHLPICILFKYSVGLYTHFKFPLMLPSSFQLRVVIWILILLIRL